MLLMRQGEQAWLLAGPEGNHEFARVFYFAKQGQEPGYHVQSQGSRVGPSVLEHVAVRDDGAAVLSWSCGRRSHIPSGWFQLTYRA